LRSSFSCWQFSRHVPVFLSRPCVSFSPRLPSPWRMIPVSHIAGEFAM
jgi:hypothetical protein